MTPNKALTRWFFIVLAAALLVRAGLYFVYPLAQSNDTPTYLHLASSLGNHGFENYNGTRTPGYPFFILLTGSQAVLYPLQLGLGVLTTLLVFTCAWQLTGLPWLAGLLALAHTLNLGQLFFEAALLSESLATFLLFAVLAGFLSLWQPRPAGLPPVPLRGWMFLAGTGLAAAALALVRPLFAPVAFWGALFLALFWQSAPWKTRWCAALLAALPAVIALGLWVNFIHIRFKIWGLDSIGGYHSVNHVSSFFELAPPEYATVTDTFLKFRAVRLAESGSPVNTIWDAIPALMQQEKLNYYGLGRLMGQISRRLILENPALYARNLVWGWWWFWRVGVFWLPETISSAGLRSALKELMLAERLALFGVNLLFLAGSLTLLWRRVRARLNPPLFFWFAVSAVWLISLLQTLAEHGDNPRFLAPMQTFVLLIVAWALAQFIPTARKV